MTFKEFKESLTNWNIPDDAIVISGDYEWGFYEFMEPDILNWVREGSGEFFPPGVGDSLIVKCVRF